MDSLRTTSPDRKAGYLALYAAICLCPAFLAGCNVIYKTSVRPPDYYYINPDKQLGTIGKVALVELGNHSSYPEISTDMTEALFQALQKRQLFSVVVVSQSESKWRSLQLEPTPPFTLDQLSAMQKALQANAVLVGYVTTYRPYPHMSIALRLWLVDLADGQLLWAFEQVWDTADKTTEKRVKQYFQSQTSSGFTQMREELVVVSPLRFVKFVAHEVADTMR